MPRMNGLEVLAWVRAQPTLAQLRTVVLTTSDDLRDIRKAYQFGASSFLTKPVNFSEFKDTVQALFNYWLDSEQKALLPFAPLPGAALSGNCVFGHLYLLPRFDRSRS